MSKPSDEDVVDLYAAANQFFDVVVADGCADIHCGIREHPDDSIKTASENTITVLMRLATSCDALLRPGARVVDLGAGNGGTAHKIAAETGAHVTCLNISEVQNARNRELVEELNLQHLVDVVAGSFEQLPEEWDDNFDVVFSIDSFCHSTDKAKVLAECFRIAKPGAILVFSDVMAGEAAPEENLSFFKKRNKIEELLTLSQYEKLLQETGFEVLRTRDFTGHLVPFLRRIVKRSKSERAKLDLCTEEFVDNYVGLISKNIELLTQGEAQAWSALVALKPVKAVGNGNVANINGAVLPCAEN